MRNFFEEVAWFGEQREWFWPAFEGARFAAVRAFWDQIEGQNFQEVFDEASGGFFGGGAVDGDTVLPNGVNRAFEADPFQRDVVFTSRFQHNRTDEVVSNEVEKKFPMNHLRVAAAQDFHLEGSFDMAKEQFDLPSLKIELGDSLSGIFFGVQQRRSNKDLACAEARNLDRNPNEANGNLFGQPVPDFLAEGSGALNGLWPGNKAVVRTQIRTFAEINRTGLMQADDHVHAAFP